MTAKTFERIVLFGFLGFIVLCIFMVCTGEAQVNVTPAPVPKLQFFDTSGRPLAGGKVYTYASGTSTPLASYTDSTGTVQNANPVILDSGGFASIWLSGASYRIIVQNSSSVQQYLVDGIAGTYANFCPLAGCTYTGGLTTVGITDSGTSQFKILNGCANVKGYGAVGNGSTDDSTAFTNALAANKCVVVPYSASGYKLNTAQSLSAGQRLYCNGSTLLHTVNTTSLLIAPGVDDWRVEDCNLQGQNGGTVAGAQVTTEILFSITGGHRWRVTNMTLTNSDGWGIKRDVGTDSAPAVHGDRGQLSNIVAKNNYTAVQFLAGSSAEYGKITNLVSVANTVGLLIQAGNITVTGGSITDNSTGVWLTQGSNHSHGIISGVDINHNGGTTGDNLFVDTVTNGFTFTGNHFYANASTNGFIHLSASHGVEFVANTIDSNIKNDAADGSINSFISNRMVSNTATLAPAGTSSSTNLYLSGNYTNAGPWLYNNVAGAIAQGVPTNLAGYDLGAARDATSGAVYFGSDANKYLFRSANQLQLGGFSSLAPASDAVATLGTSSLHFGGLFLSNCAVNSASPAACGASPTGVIAVPISQTTYTVNTTAVTTSSRIFLYQITDNTGIPTSPTCSGTADQPFVSARVAATSFTFTLTSVASIMCYEYWIVN